MSSTDTSAQASGAAAGEVAVEKSPEEFASILKQNFRIIVTCHFKQFYRAMP